MPRNVMTSKLVSDLRMSRQTGSGRVTDTKKISGELFSLTYGALVAQILKVSVSNALN